MRKMDFLDVINTRRSIRNYTHELVSKDLVAKIIETAIKAPSACNVQGWQFIVVDSDEIKQKMVDYGGSVVIKNAPVGILALYDNRTKNSEHYDYIQSAAAGIENLILAATYYGLGSCWICHLPTRKRLRKMFDVPSYFDPIAYVLLGHKQRESFEVPRKYKVNDLVSYNIFQPNPYFDIRDTSGSLFKKILVKLYYLAPLYIKKRFLNKLLDKHFVKKFKN